MKRIDWDKQRKDLVEIFDSIHDKMDKIFNKDHDLYDLYQEYKHEDTDSNRMTEIHAILVESEEVKNG